MNFEWPQVKDNTVDPGTWSLVRACIDAHELPLFAILGGGEVGTSDGISMGSVSNVEIRNGTVRGFLRYGVFAANGEDIRVIDVRALDNIADGINLEGVNAGQGGLLIRNCNVSGNGDDGLRMTGNGGLIVGNVSVNNSGAGMEVGGSVIGVGGNSVDDNGLGITGGTEIACNVVNGVQSCPP